MIRTDICPRCKGQHAIPAAQDTDLLECAGCGTIWMPGTKPEIADLWAYVVNEVRVPRNTSHGIDHWGRVARNGLYLARKANGANVNTDVVHLFSLLHDCQRWSGPVRDSTRPSADVYRARARGSLVG